MPQPISVFLVSRGMYLAFVAWPGPPRLGPSETAGVGCSASAPSIGPVCPLTPFSASHRARSKLSMLSGPKRQSRTAVRGPIPAVNAGAGMLFDRSRHRLWGIEAMSGPFCASSLSSAGDCVPPQSMTSEAREVQLLSLQAAPLAKSRALPRGRDDPVRFRGCAGKSSKMFEVAEGIHTSRPLPKSSPPVVVVGSGTGYSSIFRW
ncbi:hypothetical protein VTK73DRAFT_2635 [Phialemonium thermophilum]|uniref:Uncharacterized protein n=1 Tax=Phialemonium thermophilum TaxID=223376 RepID=A0ABR3VRN7_9PEZI